MDRIIPNLTAVHSKTYADPNVGWRSGAKKIVILFGDDIPHDPAFQTGVDPGRDAEVGTADDLYFDEVVSGLRTHGITVLALYWAWISSPGST